MTILTDIGIFHNLDSEGRMITLCVMILHFLTALMSVIAYCAWVHYQTSVLGNALVYAYRATTVVSCLSYLLFASVFYMWALRYPAPEVLAKKRRVYGTCINLLFSDIPVFVVETTIVWRIGMVNVLQGISFCVTCVSFAYSVVRVWAFLITHLVARHAPFDGPTVYPTPFTTQFHEHANVDRAAVPEHVSPWMVSESDTGHMTASGVRLKSARAFPSVSEGDPSNVSAHRWPSDYQLGNTSTSRMPVNMTPCTRYHDPNERSYARPHSRMRV